MKCLVRLFQVLSALSPYLLILLRESVSYVFFLSIISWYMVDDRELCICKHRIEEHGHSLCSSPLSFGDNFCICENENTIMERRSYGIK